MILDRILTAKAREVAATKAVRPVAQLARAAADLGPTRGFRRALAGPKLAVIAEVKKASPSKGVIRPDFDPVAIARSYSRAGASALSVLTDAPFFQGRLEYLRQIRAAVPQPLLRKDFIIDPYQVWESRVAGADCILLIAAVLSPAQLSAYRRLALDLDLDVLVEVHTREELEQARAAGADLIGVNNRDLQTFEVSLQHTYDLLPHRPPGALLVSESGISGPAEAAALGVAGVDAILVGELLMRAPDPGAKLKELVP